MPIIDDERGVLVLRLVYDGPPLSGKTTTLRTLSRGLGVQIVTPEERDGRTLYFDWVDYVGGLFDGRRIRCQIVSVPGQRELAARRAHLLETADAVVLVADSTAAPFAEALALLRDLVPMLRETKPPTGIVVQANKRDAPGALPRLELRERLDRIAPIALTETVATSGDGVREAFVLGVRLALDRVRALAEEGALPRGRPDIDDPKRLLDELRSLDEVAEAAVVASAGIRAIAIPQPEPEPEPDPDPIPDPIPVPTPVAVPAPVRDDERVFRPDPQMPGGFIWPPVDGRALVHEVARLALVPERTARGDWSASGGGWRFHSKAGAIFEDVNAGRSALISWARLHASTQRLLSPGRALILADAGRDRVRLWQLVRVEAPLRETLIDAAGRPPGAVVLALMFATMQLVRARSSLGAARARLPCTLWTVGTDPMRQPIFVGVMPEEGEPEAETHVDVAALVRRELGPVLTRLRNDRDDFSEIVRGLGATTDSSAEADGLRALHGVAVALG